MRALTFAALALVAAAIVGIADASVFVHNAHPKFNHPMHTMRAAKNKQDRAEIVKSGNRHHMRKPLSQNGQTYGNIYRAVDMFGIAVITGNETLASSLLADDGFFVLTSVACGTFNKTQFLNIVMNAPDVASRWFELGRWTGYFEDMAMFSATTAAVMGPNSEVANQTFYNHPVIVAGVTEDGTQLQYFEEFIDTSYSQSNATAMLNVFEKLKDASTLKDLNALSNLISDDGFNYGQAQAWNVAPPVTFDNKTAFLAKLAKVWPTINSVHIKVEHVFATCDFVIAEIIWSGVYVSGATAVNSMRLAIGLDQNMKVAMLSEYFGTPFY